MPLDSVSSISTGLFSSVGIFTSSGAIKFYMLGNQKEIHSAISALLLKRQDENKQNTTQNKQSAQTDYTDELLKLKTLLDAGAITQEEFESKKKELLFK